MPDEAELEMTARKTKPKQDNERPSAPFWLTAVKGQRHPYPQPFGKMKIDGKKRRWQ